ncbi:helix-turn-helix transcriptional regulator [Streptomyces sp. SID13726]|uniref:helix-turn-helix domain-containing protein n=1 Tax=Streptomyces sp. SID13726 TaxID=2706058 RepID=UPI0013BBA8F5|nr:helix-turn-helix transcriptional regulator [Streptomyces sp. SID13726]NEB04497.1 helix-turn-helix domain-containing protein [Streptomyces sp. SID13726]
MTARTYGRHAEPTARQVRLGHVLASLRDGTGQTKRDVARALSWSESKVNRIESARIGISEDDLTALLAYYKVTDRGLRAYISHLKKRGNERGWETKVRDIVSTAYADLIGYEDDASDAYAAQAIVIPGLLQTSRYAGAVIDQHMPDIAEEEREERLAIRAKRQEIFKRPNPLVFWGVISESVFRHVIGSREIMAEQLGHLLEMCETYPHAINIQVLPEEAASHAVLFGPFVILSFPERWEPDITYLEGLTANRFLEEPSEVQAYSRFYKRLMTDSLTGAESFELIKNYRDTYSKG